MSIVKLLRPKHWIKNIFVLGPLFFAFQFLDLASLGNALLAFAAFSLSASGVYIINDIFDREKDRLHPEKKNRPIASGAVSIPAAVVTAAVLIIGSLVLSYLLSVTVLIIIGIYLVINGSYSLWLKRIAIIDVFIISAGFILRIFAGAYAIAVPVSRWIILITFFISLFLGFSKRKNEIDVNDAEKHRNVLTRYNIDVLVLYIVISAVLTLVTYTFYLIDEETLTRFYGNRIIYTLPLVVYGLFRYILSVFKDGKGGDVAELLLKDYHLIVTLLLWLGILLWAHRW